jgi:copper chaperone CopZ
MTTTLTIEGMSCHHCAAHVKKALEAIGGVSSAQVDLQKKNALIEHADSVNPGALKTAVSEAGYDPS